jgi:hypothetical protein
MYYIARIIFLEFGFPLFIVATDFEILLNIWVHSKVCMCIYRATSFVQTFAYAIQYNLYNQALLWMYICMYVAYLHINFAIGTFIQVLKRRQKRKEEGTWVLFNYHFHHYWQKFKEKDWYWFWRMKAFSFLQKNMFTMLKISEARSTYPLEYTYI